MQPELGGWIAILELLWCCAMCYCIVQAIRRNRLKDRRRKRTPFQEQETWRNVISVPGLVRNLRVTGSDPKEPSVTLTWDPPFPGSCDITCYEVHFQSCSGGHAYMTRVDSHTTSVCITKGMGLEPLRLCLFKVRAKGQVPGEWSEVSKFVDAIPGPVRNLRVMGSDPKEPSVILAWDPPLGNCDITSYEVHFQNYSGGHAYMTGVDSHTTSVCITKEMGLEPLRLCVFKARAKGQVPGEWSEVSKFTDWHCHLPGCEDNRCRLNCDHDCIYGFCGRQHYINFTKSYCLYDDCCKPRVDGRSDFCSSEHLEMAIDKGFAAVVQVDAGSKLYETLCHKFKADWDPAKGPCPLILTILRIINPYLQRRLKNYVEGVPWWYRKTEQYYHGTKLKCKITDYYRLCGGSSCGICGIAANGFSRNRIRTRSWQRFGNGFYLAPNSSKSHDYPVNRSSSINQDTFQALLLCDVAPGRKYKLRENASSMTRPPEGYHSVYGTRKSFWRNSVLNYDEIVLFDPNAISPKYVFVYSNM